MGKAAKRARSKRNTYFASLAKENPEKFEFEYNKRLSSWIAEIKAGGANKRRRILSEAYNILNTCGKEIYNKYAPVTYEILFEQFNPSFFISVDRCVSNYSKLEEIGALHGRLKEGRRKTYYEKSPV